MSETLLYEQVPVRVAGGLLFELLGQSVGDPCDIEEDLPVVIRSWQAQKFLLTALHVKGTSSNINVLGVSEVQVRQLGFYLFFWNHLTDLMINYSVESGTACSWRL